MRCLLQVFDCHFDNPGSCFSIMRHILLLFVLPASFGMIVPAQASFGQHPNATPVAQTYNSGPGQPAIHDKWPGHDAERIENAFLWVNQITSWIVYQTTKAQRKPILGKYFSTTDDATIVAVFKSMAGSDPHYPTIGSSLLENISIYNTDARGFCRGDPRTMAYGDSITPAFFSIDLCRTCMNHKSAWEILKAPDFCAYMGDHVSFLMNTIETTLLHEYL